MKSEKGITLITLSITIIVLLILLSTITIKTPELSESYKKNKFQNDITSLKEEIDQYYARNKDIPILGAVYTNTSMLESIKNVNDNNYYYIIDISELSVNLNYGKDYEKIGTTDISNITDIYIINEQSHTIYYPAGIEYDGEKHYTINNNYTAIN